MSKKQLVKATLSKFSVKLIFLVLFSFVAQHVLSADLVPVPAPSPLPLILPSSDSDPKAYESMIDKGACSSQSCHYWADYVKANFFRKSDPNRACQLYLGLSTKDDFPLFPLALIRASQVCSQKIEKPENFLDDIDQYLKKEKPRRWLHVQLLFTAVNEASFLSNKEFVERSLAAARFTHNKKSKVDLLLKALEKAKKVSRQKVKEVQDELTKASPRFQKPPADWWTIGLDAYNAKDFDTSLKAFNHVLKMKIYPTPVKRQALEQIKSIYKISQKRGLALKTALRLWKWDRKDLKMKNATPDAPRHYLNSGLSLARFYWTDHKNKEARDLIATLLDELKKKTIPLGDVYFLKARIEEEEGNVDPAIADLNESLKDTQDPVLKSQYQWALAWLSFKQAKFTDALATLKALKDVETDSGKKSQQSFWLGKSYQALKQTDLATKEFEDLIDEDPLGYYSLLAYRELKRPIPKFSLLHSPSSSKIPRKTNVSGNYSWTVLDWLIAVGELDLAHQLLDEEVPVPDLSVVADWEVIFQKYAQAQYYSPLFGRLAKLSAPEKIKLLNEHPEFLFPKPYEELVDEASHRWGLWPEYVFSIMRQESSFDTTSVSPANAYGLLQLLPSVAKNLAATKGIKYKEPDDLLDPSLNVPLGSLHLRNYWDTFSGQFILATAAYNASPESVKNWVRVRFHGNILQFIEDIPYEETRTYVKLVLRNFINYQRLNTASDSVTFPEWCLEDVQTANN